MVDSIEQEFTFLTDVDENKWLHSISRRVLVDLAFTIVLLSCTACPFHGWQSFQDFVLDRIEEDGLATVLQSTYAWATSLEMMGGLVSGALLDIFGAVEAGVLGLFMYLSSSAGIGCLMMLRNGSLSMKVSNFLLLHPSIAMNLWRVLLGTMFFSSTFTSVSIFVFKGRLSDYRLSTICAGVQYISSLVSFIWWILAIRLPSVGRATILISSTIITGVMVYIWAVEMGTRSQLMQPLPNPERAEEVEMELTEARLSRPDSFYYIPRPPPSKTKLFLKQLIKGPSTVFTNYPIFLFLCWYGSAIFMMTLYDSRFRTILLASTYSEIPPSLIALASLVVAAQGPINFVIGEFIERIPHQKRVHVIPLLCITVALLYTISVLCLKELPYISVVASAVAGSFVYGSKYWFLDLLSQMPGNGHILRLYGTVTGTVQLVAGIVCLCNLVVTTEHSIITGSIIGFLGVFTSLLLYKRV